MKWMNGRPSCWKMISWPNWKSSMSGYSPWPLPAQVPISQASGAHSSGGCSVGSRTARQSSPGRRSVKVKRCRIAVTAQTPTPSSTPAITTTKNASTQPSLGSASLGNANATTSGSAL